MEEGSKERRQFYGHRSWGGNAMRRGEAKRKAAQMVTYSKKFFPGGEARSERRSAVCRREPQVYGDRVQSRESMRAHEEMGEVEALGGARKVFGEGALKRQRWFCNVQM